MKKVAIIFLIISSNLLLAQPTIDGDMGDGQYSTIASFTSGRNGFGDDNDLGNLRYYSDGTTMYVGVTGELTSNDNMVIFMNFSGYTGRTTNTLAGSSTSSIGVFTTSSGGLDGAIMDMDVDFALAFNEGVSTTNFYLDAARFGSGSGGYLSTSYIGNSGSQSGGTGTLDISGTFGGTGNITFGYNNNFSGNANKGVEFSIPIAAFAGVDNSQTVQFFIIITNNVGFMSNECIPGDPGSSNLGNDANLSTISGQDFFTSSNPLPVELTSFTASVEGNIVTLNWQTATEINNSGFEILRSAQDDYWESIGFVEGYGNSNSPKEYSFTDDLSLTSTLTHTLAYRLRQIDNDGTFDYSNIVEVFIGELPNGFVLEQNYPNPFNPSTKIKFGVDKQSEGTLKVFNTNGEEVAELFSGRLDAGRIYEVEFKGDGIPSGVYLYKLQTPERTEVKKMLLLK
jgi:hypothetical protein